MIPIEDDGIEIECRLLRQKERSALALLDALAPRSEHLVVVMCSWCKRIKQAADDWLELERAVDKMSLVSGAPLPAVTASARPARSS